MSKSYRKTPIMGHTTCRSERLDKLIWHKRWRTKERNKITSLDPENWVDHLTVDRHEVSNPWSMGKDGKQYFPRQNQIHVAKKIANRHGQNPQERSALRQRLLHQWMGK
jgi:hypothetical protein